MHRIPLTLTIVFFLFILWVIYMADAGQSSIFFDLVKAIPYGDKIGHAFLFGFLTLGANISTRFKQIAVGRAGVYMGTALVSLFVLAEELSQYFVAVRTFDITDLMADAVGILTFTLVSMRLSREKPPFQGLCPKG